MKLHFSLPRLPQLRALLHLKYLRPALLALGLLAVGTAGLLSPSAAAAEATPQDAAAQALHQDISARELAVFRTSLSSGIEVMGQKPTLPRLLPSDTSVKAVGRILENDTPLYFSTDDDSDIYVFIPQDAYVTVLEDHETMLRVSYNDCTGFVDENALTLLKRGERFSCYAIVDTEELSVYPTEQGDSTGDEPVATLGGGERIAITGFSRGWFAMEYDDTVGFVSGDSLDLTLEKEKPAPPPPPPAPPAEEDAGEGEEGAEDGTDSENSADGGAVSGSSGDLVSFALQFTGVPYAYGGSSPSGFDCSGFTRYVFSQYGVSLPHGATSQLNYGAEVSKDNLQPGDLVFFYGTYNTSSAASHCGIYVGGGQFVHSASSNNRGITVSNLGDAYYTRHYLTARRISF